MRPFKITQIESEAYHLKFEDFNGTGWGVCVLTHGCISFFGDYGNYQFRGISPADIDSLKAWIIGTAEGNLDYVMSKSDARKVLVGRDTLEANFREFVKEYEIELDDRDWEEVQQKLEEYEEMPSEITAMQLFEIATDDAWELSDCWREWDAAVRAFYDQQFRAFAEFFKKQLKEKQSEGMKS